MANFMKAFEDQRENYLAHYGKKGMRWGVITSEYEPVGNQPSQQQDYQSNPSYSQQDQESMQQSADAVRQADAEIVNDKRKRIVKNIVKGVAIGAIVAGIAVGAAKGYAKKETGESQDLKTSLGIIGRKIHDAPGKIAEGMKKGYNTETAESVKETYREKVRSDKTEAATQKAKDWVSRKESAPMRDIQRKMGKPEDSVGSGAKKLDFGSIAAGRKPNAEAMSWYNETHVKAQTAARFRKEERERATARAEYLERMKKEKKLRNRYNGSYTETKRSRIYRG